jgi:hypothetical protein
MGKSTLNQPFTIEHAIMHHLDPKKNELILVGEEIALTPPVRDLFCQLLIVSAESADTHAVDTSGSAPALLACRSLLGDSSRFVALSRELAEQLYVAMGTNVHIVAGDLMVVMGLDAEGSFVALAKTEPNTEYRVEYKKRSSGVSYVDITPTDAIAPSKDKPPQKCAFVREAPFENGADVFMVDNQSRYSDHNVAKFFCNRFLGCELLETAAARTMRFCRAVELWRYTNAKYLPGQGVMAFMSALHVHLQQPSVDFRAFANSALEGVSNEWVSPSVLAAELTAKVYEDLSPPRPTSFEPEHAVAEKLVSSIHLTLFGGIQLTGPSDEILKRIGLAEDGGELVFRITSPSVRRTFQKPKQ